MNRVNVYIDGYNFYHGLKKMRKNDPDYQQFYWLDFVKFFDHFILRGQTLHKVYYFSAIDHDPERNARQKILFRANKIINENRLEIIYGKYYPKNVKCKLCTGLYKIHEEKRTDVNICAYMMSDCANNNVDDIMLVTADSDLVTPIEIIRKNYPDKQLRLFFPPEVSSRDLTNVMKAIKKLPIQLIKHKQKFINSLLPETVSKDGFTYTIPQKWKNTYIKPTPTTTPTTYLTDLYEKHFGKSQTIEHNHPNMTSFVNDLNAFIFQTP